MSESVPTRSLLERFSGGIGAPSHVTILATDRCNYDCVHCYQEHIAQDELTTDEIFALLDDLADMGVLYLALMGGEYFMRPDADAIIRRANELGFAQRILSTGHHIHARRADFLASMRPLQVDLSLYGSKPEIHEQVTRQKGSWKRTFEAAKRLIDRKVPVLLKSPVMQSNVEDLAELRDLAASLGAQFQLDAKLTAVENGDTAPVELRASAESLRELYAGAGAQDLDRMYPNPESAAHRRALHQTPCRAGQTSCSVTPRGDIWPCNSLSISMGNIRQQSFRDIWRGSAELEEIRDLRWAKLSECNACPVRNYCDRCHGMAFTEQGDMKGPSLEACRHAVFVRDSLRERGLVPEDDTALPPTWDRVDPDGQHHLKVPARGRRPRALRVIG